MAMKESTGLRNARMATGSMKSQIDNMFFDYYSGSEPASADAAPTGTKLCRISVGGTGTACTWDNAGGGVLTKAAAETWSGTVIAGGVVGYFRGVKAGDSGALSTTDIRIQGSCGTAGADLNFTNTTLTLSATETLKYLSIVQPTN